MSTTIPNTQAPTNNDYGGDEVSALVLDPGSYYTRAGFAGEDVPKSVVPTYYGSTPERPHLFGENALYTPLPEIEARTPMARDGTVEDWDAAAKLWQYAITANLLVPKARSPRNNGLNDPKQFKPEHQAQLDAVEEQESQLRDHPLLMTEPGWNAPKNREKSIEIAMEDWGCPAFWLAKNGVLSAFANGRSSALVIDVGAASTSITPVHDGIQLRKGTLRTPLAGDFLSQQTRALFASATPPVPIHPHYTIAGKSAVDAGVPPAAAYRAYPPELAPRPSWVAVQEERVLHEFRENVVQVWPGPGRFLAAGPPQLAPEALVERGLGPRAFEFPDGANQAWGPERFRVAEGLFDAKAAFPLPEGNSHGLVPSASQTLPAALQQAIGACDADVKAHLLGGVVVVGGGSLCWGFNDRVSEELQGLFSGAKVRVHSPGNTYERKYASWIGGSILASLGTFHQMWISKKEYEEQGANIVEKRCK